MTNRRSTVSPSNLRVAAATFALLLLASRVALAADAALIEAAKKEGEVVWYTTQIQEVIVRPVIAAFERAYGIKVRPVHAATNVLATRIYNETKAGHTQADVFDGTATVEPLKKAGYVLQWMPDSAKKLPPEYKDRDGYWVACNLYVITPAYNTQLVPKDDVPKTLDALLDPKWHGRMAWSALPSGSGAPAFIGAVLADMGNDKGMAYLHNLARQQIANVGSLARAVLDQVISGEYAISLQIFNHQALESASKGAPVQWVPIGPATEIVQVVSVHKSAPHPNAAKLLVEFLMSPEGQKIYQAGHYLPADPAIAPLNPELLPQQGNFRAITLTPEASAEKMPTWKKIFDEIFG